MDMIKNDSHFTKMLKTDLDNETEQVDIAEQTYKNLHFFRNSCFFLFFRKLSEKDCYKYVTEGMKPFGRRSFKNQNNNF